MRTIDHPFSVPKIRTEIDGFDLIANGGLPRGRVTLVSGTSGSAKTVFAAQFLAAGLCQADENGVFVTFEESPEDIRRNMKGFGWDIETWESESRWAFVDASPQPGEPLFISGRYDLGALLARIEHAVKRVNAKRISVDSLGGIFAQLSDEVTIRQELFRLTLALKRDGPDRDHHGRAYRRLRIDRPLRRRGIRLGQRDRAPQRPGGRGPSADGRDPQVPGDRSPEGRVAVHDRAR